MKKCGKHFFSDENCWACLVGVSESLWCRKTGKNVTFAFFVSFFCLTVPKIFEDSLFEFPETAFTENCLFIRRRITICREKPLTGSTEKSRRRDFLVFASIRLCSDYFALPCVENLAGMIK